MGDGHIPRNRPYDDRTSLPLCLLDPIIGKFVDEAENYVATPDDIQFLFAFVQVMANIYRSERDRRTILRNIFNSFEIPIERTRIGKNLLTDGDLSIGPYRFLIAELKDEIGSTVTGAEPFAQATLHYLEATRNLAAEHPNSVLPCIIVLAFGL
jgi:hypothetical protein